MLKKLYLSALLMTAAAGSLAANFAGTDGNFRVTGEYLYLMPSIDDTYFVIDSPETTTFPNGKRKNNDFDFHSGFRVGVGYSCDDNSELSVSYARLSFNQSKTVTGDFLWATLGRADFTSSFENYTGTASSKHDYTYQRLDALYGQKLFDCSNFSFGVAFGLEAAELRLTDNFTYVSAAEGGSIGTVHQHSRTRGIGPELGFGLDYLLYKGDACSCPGSLSFRASTSGSLLAADTKSDANNVLDTATILDVSESKSWRVIPALHARVGLNYDFGFSCLDASLGIGYEFTSYIRGLSRVAYPDDVADGLSYNQYDNFDLQGLYVSGSVRF